MKPHITVDRKQYFTVFIVHTVFFEFQVLEAVCLSPWMLTDYTVSLNRKVNFTARFGLHLP